jgi:adenylate cyclase
MNPDPRWPPSNKRAVSGKPNLLVVEPGHRHTSETSAAGSRPSLPSGILPAAMVTAVNGAKEQRGSLDCPADYLLTEPISLVELFAGLRSLLRMQELSDMVQAQAAQLAELKRKLEQVQQEVARRERPGPRPSSSAAADPMPPGTAVDAHATRRREVTVVFLDLRGFTAFVETGEPEEVLAVLREYHAEMGRLIQAHEGTLERFTGDGMMVLFNAPIAVPDPTERAVRMAFAMRERVTELTGRWRKQGHELDFGVGVAQGYATIGAIGFEGRWDYGAIGPVTNLAARLCAEAKPGQILVSRRVVGAVETLVRAEPVGNLTLKGFLKPVPAFNVVALAAQDRTLDSLGAPDDDARH